MRTRLAHTLTGHYRKDEREREREKKKSTSVPEECETMERFKESPQINIGNVGFNRNSASFPGIFFLPDGLN